MYKEDWNLPLIPYTKTCLTGHATGRRSCESKKMHQRAIMYHILKGKKISKRWTDKRDSFEKKAYQNSFHSLWNGMYIYNTYMYY